MLVPAVKTQAPVVLAAFSRPFLITFFSLDCRSKFALPPCTVMSSFGRSSPHSPVRSCRVLSGLVSWANRMYCKGIVTLISHFGLMSMQCDYKYLLEHKNIRKLQKAWLSTQGSSCYSLITYIHLSFPSIQPSSLLLRLPTDYYLFTMLY